MKWLNDLIQRIEALSDEDVASQKPDKEVGKDEKVLGIIPDGLRKIFAYRGILVDKYNAMRKEHEKEHSRPNHTDEMCEKFGASMSLLDDEIEVTGKAFWRELRDELKINVNPIALREDWKVVETQDSGPTIRLIGIGIEDPLGILMHLRG